MILGIGHDITSLRRIETLLQGETGERFSARILTESERAAASELRGGRLAEYVAGRFASKEAVSKALGCGIGATLGFHDIVIGRSPLGKPQCKLSGEAWDRLGLIAEQTVVHVTITHDSSLASAFVVVERVQA
ncbi:holo-ACP synthase [Paenibacillus mendelii]|uniref:Holo-[acyl-carrier-protein] synthase n=1 Tax=Paenibacillus mendelii TaxID=206163 RepID=A0ABV6J8J0_9BACL|nr:holo-ACP synthase [Paenibacillus mendelii]MCQ6559548.1 holo-ACP synthase [Paenibacillus mendelii]